MPKLIEAIREKLDAGVLPRGDPVKLWAGYGRGLACSACGEPIITAQTEYEFDGGDGHTYRFHVGCHGLWEAERRRRRLSKPEGFP